MTFSQKRPKHVGKNSTSWKLFYYCVLFTSLRKCKSSPKRPDSYQDPLKLIFSGYREITQLQGKDGHPSHSSAKGKNGRSYINPCPPCALHFTTRYGDHSTALEFWEVLSGWGLIFRGIILKCFDTARGHSYIHCVKMTSRIFEFRR